MNNSLVQLIIGAAAGFIATKIGFIGVLGLGLAALVIAVLYTAAHYAFHGTAWCFKNYRVIPQFFIGVLEGMRDGAREAIRGTKQ